ncbi:MAG TPA: inositol monophosphatase [Kiloniellales bacterium]|nr:inositol monophosphatase [Kiloniellales bacterium]
MRFTPDRVRSILEETAAEVVLPRFRALQTHEVREKDSGELITIADLEAERRIAPRLEALLPGSRVIGEEAAESDPGLLERLDEEYWLWVVDPIDGTGNFARGKPDFAMMVGLIHGGETVGAWIHRPVAGTTAIAEAGAGAREGSTRLTVASAPHTVAAMAGTLHADSFAPAEMARLIRNRRERVAAVKSLRCAGLEYLRLARGEMHFSLFTRLMPWDHVPGTLIHVEAGGVARTLDGRPYRARSLGRPGLLMAPDAAAWSGLFALLFGESAYARVLEDPPEP